MAKSLENSVRSLVVIPDSRTVMSMSRQNRDFITALTTKTEVQVANLPALLRRSGLQEPVGLICIGDGISRGLTLARTDSRVGRIVSLASTIINNNRDTAEPTDPVALLHVASGESQVVFDRSNLANVRGFGIEAPQIAAVLTDSDTLGKIFDFMGLPQK